MICISYRIEIYCFIFQIKMSNRLLIPEDQVSISYTCKIEGHLMIWSQVNISILCIINAEVSYLQVVHMTWTQERVSPMRHFQAWKPKFLCLKGAEICLFDVPPVSFVVFFPFQFEICIYLIFFFCKFTHCNFHIELHQLLVFSILL